MSQRTRFDDAVVRRDDSEDRSTLVADFGPGVSATVDVVGDTAIVVLETEEGTLQREFDVPAGSAQAFNNNGVVTVEVER